MKKITLATAALAMIVPSLSIAETVVAQETPVQSVTVDPVFVDLYSDDGVNSRLKESGYDNVVVTRDGNKLNITADKDGVSQNLEYDTTTGTLVKVDGAGYTVGTAPRTPQVSDNKSTSEQH